MPTRGETLESEEKMEAVMPAAAKQARDARRALRAQVRTKAQELNGLRPQPPAALIERVLDGIRQGQTVELGWP